VSASGVPDLARSKGVNSVVRPDVAPTGTPPGPEDNFFCFDLTFDPVGAVASPFANNAGIIATADVGQGATGQSNCTAPNNDALVRTYGSDGAPVGVGFFVIFE
jgi:hypothetical protein